MSLKRVTGIPHCQLFLGDYLKVQRDVALRISKLGPENRHGSRGAPAWD